MEDSESVEKGTTGTRKGGEGGNGEWHRWARSVWMVKEEGEGSNLVELHSLILL
jgi:hypothetical protein